MSQSPLATYTHYSPNCTKPRQGTIKGVAIHCTAGGRNLPAKSFADMARFSQRDPKNGASCHYVIGGDGSIAQVCKEENRAWCTSNPIDHYLITIEVASDANNPCNVNMRAISALLDLLTDICKRNGIKKMLWEGKKSLMWQWDKQNMVVHRWTAEKSCPGDYLYSLHGCIASAVNKRLSQETQEGEDEMTIDEIINGMTGKQAAELYQKAIAYIGAQSEPEWSQKEGHWQKATLKKVVDGQEPERPVKRDELTAVLGRLGVLD